ncbi:hypothetical protein D7006_06130 [Xanthobacter sp. YC-JY1]|nr:hypothetical protein D7006_06130 [Xanthobacter sp. YC-JY1]
MVLRLAPFLRLGLEGGEFAQGAREDRQRAGVLLGFGARRGAGIGGAGEAVLDLVDLPLRRPPQPLEQAAPVRLAGGIGGAVVGGLGGARLRRLPAHGMGGAARHGIEEEGAVRPHLAVDPVIDAGAGEAGLPADLRHAGPLQIKPPRQSPPHRTRGRHGAAVRLLHGWTLEMRRK